MVQKCQTLKQNKQHLLQYMRTFSTYTSRSHACTPATAVKIHPANIQPPIQPHVNSHNIPTLLHFIHLMTYSVSPQTQCTIFRTVQHNTTDQLFCYLFFIIMIVVRKEQQQFNYILKPIYIINVLNLRETRLLCFLLLFITITCGRFTKLFPDPLIIPDVKHLPNKL